MHNTITMNMHPINKAITWANPNKPASNLNGLCNLQLAIAAHF